MNSNLMMTGGSNNGNGCNFDWIPIGGCTKLKEEIDEKANARKKARFNGCKA